MPAMRARLRWLPAALLYVLVALFLTWPLASRLNTHFSGFEYGDSSERAHHIWWLARALQEGRPLFWQAELGWPEGIDGITMWAHPLQIFPAWLLAFFLPLPLADNLAILGYMLLGGLGMRALAAGLLRESRGAALLAGLVFLCAPAIQAHLGGGHAMNFSPFAPWFLHALLRLLRAPGFRHRDFAAAALLFVLGCGGHVLQALYMLLPLIAVLTLRQFWCRDWRALKRTLLVGAAGSALLLILVLPVAAATLGTAVYTETGGHVRYSADLLAIVTPSFFHPLYSGLEFNRQVLGVNIEEGSAYIGIVPGALALVALFRLRRRDNGYLAAWLLLALLAWILSLGPLLKVLDRPVTLQSDGHASFLTLPFALLQWLPLMELARTPGRFSITLALAGALLAAYGADLLLRNLAQRPGMRRALLLALMAVTVLDMRWFWPFPTWPAEIPAPVRALAGRDDLRAALDLPARHVLASKDGLWLRTGHQLPLVGGQVTRATPVNPARLALLETTLAPALLRQAGADLVIVHKRHAPSWQRERARARLGPALYEDDRLALYETPDAPAPEFTALVAETGRIAAAAESYVYTPAAGWVDLRGRLRASGREISLRLDGVELARWHVAGEEEFRRTLPVQAGGWHRLTLAPVEACPRAPAPALVCAELVLPALALDYLPAAAQEARFAQGVTLRGGAHDAQIQPGGELVARLHWQFDAGRTASDLRFLHLLDAEGNLVAQSDESPGTLASGSQLAERIALPLPASLAPGDYRLLLGWYRQPSLERLLLLAPAGADELLLLGVARVG